MVERGVPINNDAVAVEAGSKPGAIKRSRKAYGDFIGEIKAAEKMRLAARPPVVAKSSDSVAPALADAEAPLQTTESAKVKELERLLDESLEREVCLLHEVRHLREALAQQGGSRVVALGLPGSVVRNKEADD